jgi:membrane protease subunit HflC
MRTARQQEARSIQAQGAKQAQIIRAEADAEAANIYAEAFGKDPDFFDFYRAMQSYESTFVNNGSGQEQGRSSIILSPNNSYLREFQGRR